VGMSNPFRELRQITQNHKNLTADELLHALQATIYAECCDQCNDHLHSQKFLEAFDHLLSDLEFCKRVQEAAKRAA
jgi:hypothetical protein